MVKCIVFVNQKGGVGKSTVCWSLGSGLTLRGYKVLMIDMDAQQNLSYFCGVVHAPYSTMEVLTGSVSAADAIIETEQGDIIPAGSGLAVADLQITETGKEYRLKEALEPVKDQYDYILIDSPPALGILTVNGLVAADEAIVPVQPSTPSLIGVGLLNQSIEGVRKYCNAGLKIRGLLVTYNISARSNASKDHEELLEDAAAQLGTKVLDTKIRMCSKVADAQRYQKSIYSYAPRSNAAADFSALMDEIIGEV